MPPTDVLGEAKSDFKKSLIRTVLHDDNVNKKIFLVISEG